jgi:excinuclease UvrABC ATPase subunit
MCGIVLGVLFLAAGAAFAQQGQQSFPLPSAGEVVAKMKEKLNLSDEQVKQIAPIIEEDFQQRKEIVAQSKTQGLGREAVRSKMAALRQSTKSKLTQCLTPEQLEILKNEPLSPNFNVKGSRGGIKGMQGLVANAANGVGQ